MTFSDSVVIGMDIYRRRTQYIKLLYVNKTVQACVSEELHHTT